MPRHRAKSPHSLRLVPEPALRLLSPERGSSLPTLLDEFLIGLPELSGSPIRVSTLPKLTASRGRLLSGSPHRGTSVHAACFIRLRRIVLESGLLRYPRLLRLILIHEIFHFVWVRLGNAKRDSFDRLLQREFAAQAKGELGESAEIKKAAHPFPGTPGWRDYVCESFCDSAASFYSGFHQPVARVLAKRWEARRRLWFTSAFAQNCRC